MKKIYLDYAAATPLDPRVKQAMAPYETKQFYNPSALYTPARQAVQTLGAARSEVARELAAKPTEIIFTAGATEANNLAIQGVLRRHSGEIVVSAIEHEAVIAPAQGVAKRVKICPVSADGTVDLTRLAKLITDKTVLVSIGYVNNEIGVIQPLGKIAAVLKTKQQARKSNLPLYFHTDASQAANYLSLNTNRLGVDLLSLNGGKIYGPKQSGCLYVRSGVDLEPLIYGGGQERGLRSGTASVAVAVGFATALKLAAQSRAQEGKRLLKLQQHAKASLQDIDNLRFNGESKQRIPSILNISIEGINGETLVHHLDQAGVMVATGAACSANADKPSTVLLALGLDIDKVNSSLRISMGKDTTEPDMEHFVKQLKLAVGKLRQFS